MKQKFEKWEKWLKNIYDEVTDLSVLRHIFWEVQEIIKDNTEIQKPSAFYEFIGNTYVASALMALRRQIKIDKGSISFAGLLKEISECPEIMSRERFTALYKGSAVEHHADRDFDKFAGKARPHIDPDIVLADLQGLKTKAEACERYADKRIAHFDTGPVTVPTFNDLDECINLLETLIKKYYLLFTAGGVSSVLPTFQYDWQAIFRVPWIKEVSE
jgi:hypothetical protein